MSSDRNLHIQSEQVCMKKKTSGREKCKGCWQESYDNKYTEKFYRKTVEACMSEKGLK